MSLAGFSFCLFIYIYVHVGVYVRIKTVPSFTATQRLGGHELITTNSYVYVVRSHSISVDLISHFTPQKIFNKSKKRKEEYKPSI